MITMELTVIACLVCAIVLSWWLHCKDRARARKRLRMIIEAGEEPDPFKRKKMLDAIPPHDLL